MHDFPTPSKIYPQFQTPWLSITRQYWSCFPQFNSYTCSFSPHWPMNFVCCDSNVKQENMLAAWESAFLCLNPKLQLNPWNWIFNFFECMSSFLPAYLQKVCYSKNITKLIIRFHTALYFKEFSEWKSWLIYRSLDHCFIRIPTYAWHMHLVHGPAFNGIRLHFLVF